MFEAELTFEITDETGRPRQFGSVAGGGRYDDLVKRFTVSPVPATGISHSAWDRLLAALRAKGRSTADTTGPVVVTVMDRDRMADIRRWPPNCEAPASGPRCTWATQELRQPAQIRRQAPKPRRCYSGGTEAAAGTVILKDLILGAKIAENASLEEWKARPAQVTVPRADLVSAVQKMLKAD